jgi:hypothetical protein
MSLIPIPTYEPIRVQLGDIAVSDSWVTTPVGTYPLRGTTWTVTNQTYLTESIPTWAIVMTIIGIFFCLLGLLFLLVKERKLYGAMQVTVQGPGLSHSTYIPVSSTAAIYQINARVDWIRSQVARLPYA